MASTVEGAKEAKLRQALRGVDLDQRDERYVLHFVRFTDLDTIEVLTRWLDAVRSQGPA
jgi:hypothetical protein